MWRNGRLEYNSDLISCFEKCNVGTWKVGIKQLMTVIQNEYSRRYAWGIPAGREKGFGCLLK